MAPASNDRRRMHEDLRELAKLAKSEPSPAAASTPHAFESADSSGYVDLSAYSASDPHWVEREIARASARPRGPRALAPESMAPVSLEAFTSTDDSDTVISARRRRRLFALTAVVAGACAALSALVVVQRTWSPFHPVGRVAAAHVAAPPAPAPIPSPAAPPATATAASIVQATPTTSAASEATPAPSPSAPTATANTNTTTTAVAASAKPSKKRAGRPGHTHAGAPHAAPAHVAAARPPSPAPQKAAGGDSLMDLIRQSVDKGKH